MDSTDLQRKLTPRTRVVVIQHTFGIPANLDPLLLVANNAGIPVVEDCCHTLGSRYGEQLVGTFGAASFYSYEWGKPIVAGIGGSALINDLTLQNKVHENHASYRPVSRRDEFQLELQYLAHQFLYRPGLYWPVRTLYHSLSELGIIKGSYNPVNPGTVSSDFSLRMAKPSLRRLSRKLQKTETYIQYNRWLANEYKTKINSRIVEHPQLAKMSDTLFSRYPLLTQHKTALLSAAAKKNIELAGWYSTPVHPLTRQEWQSVYYTAGTCPNAETRCEQIVTLPIHTGVDAKTIKRTIDFLSNVFV